MGWRVGRSLGRTIYHDNEFMGIMETAELAELVVIMLQEAGPGWDAGLFAAVPTPVPEFHRHMYATEACADPECPGLGALKADHPAPHRAAGNNAMGPICACGHSWLPRANRCASQLPGSPR
jgi:hypothetical protein